MARVAVTSRLRFRDAANKPCHCIADLLLKDAVLLNYTEIAATEIAEGRWRDFEFYANDTWKVHPRVTLTLGLRYSRFPPAWEKDNRISNFLPSLYNGVDFNTGLVTSDEGSPDGIGTLDRQHLQAGLAASCRCGVGCLGHWQDGSQNGLWTLYESFQRHRRSSSLDG